MLPREAADRLLPDLIKHDLRVLQTGYKWIWICSLLEYITALKRKGKWGEN